MTEYCLKVETFHSGKIKIFRILKDALNFYISLSYISWFWRLKMTAE